VRGGLSTLVWVLSPLRRNRKFVVGTAVFASIVVSALVGRCLVPYDPLLGLFPPNRPPGPGHPLGVDALGRDILAQLFMAIVQSLEIGLTVAFLGTFIGSLMGFVAGYFGGLVDHVLRGLIDLFITIPMLPILILIAASVRTLDVGTMVLILSMFAWAVPARQVRAQTLSLKEREFVYMAKLSGMGGLEIITFEIMPHMLLWMGANFVNATLWAIRTEVSLAILGLGPQNTATLGMMIYWAMLYAAVVTGRWWWWAPPIVALIAIFLSLYLIYAGLDEVFNPRLRRE